MGLSVGGVLQDVPPVTVLVVEVDPEDPFCVGDPLSDPLHSHVEQHVQDQVEAEGEVHETDLGRKSNDILMVLQSIITIH